MPLNLMSVLVTNPPSFQDDNIPSEQLEPPIVSNEDEYFHEPNDNDGQKMLLLKAVLSWSIKINPFWHLLWVTDILNELQA